MTSVTIDDLAVSGGVTDVPPDLLERWLAEGGTVLVDVREDFEHAEERIAGAESAPLSRFDAAALRARHGSARLVFHCRSGKRSADAAGRFRREGEAVYHLAGGIEGWKAAGRAVVRPAKGPAIPVMRQVQITIGAFVAAGTGLGAFVSEWFLIVPAFMGCGLLFAGTTGWCGLAMLMGVMPWNRGVKRAASCAV